MDDSPLVVAQAALGAGLSLDLDQCEAIAETLRGKTIDESLVRAAAEDLGYAVPVAA